ncbi:MAG: DUF4838 domain-containing protein [Lentisphaeria bacterium]|nr:DUF4838 domain-containing protein [Lentisphaeria bacterium]
MKKLLFAAALFAAVLSAEEKLPVAATGYSWNVKDLHANVLAKNRVGTKVLNGKWLTPEEYGPYSVVYIGELLKGLKPTPSWKTADETKALRDYLTAGGIVITSGSVAYQLLWKNPSPEVPALFGFKKMVKAKPASGVKVAGTDKVYPWQAVSAYAADGLTTAVPLLVAEGTGQVLATWNAVGQGGIVWISPLLGRLRERYAKQKKSLGTPDDVGNFVFTPEGEALDALGGFYMQQFQRSKRMKIVTPAGNWDLKPLGKPGDLKLNTEFRNKPVFRAKAVRKPGLVLFRDGKTAAIVLPEGSGKKLAALANELKYHLDTMSGADFLIVGKIPADRPALVFGTADAVKDFGLDPAKLQPGTAAVVRRDNKVLIGGNSDAGVSRALTYLLEALGCRYLWPGKTGKVIPRRREIVLPELELVQAPVLKVRGIRVYSFTSDRWFKSLGRFGMDGAELAKQYRAAAQDHPGNRGFFKWHGVNDGVDSERTEVANPRAAYVWGHAFNNYYRLYGKAHPEFFALQPDGSRRQPERPQLCMSNRKLAEVTAANLIARFEKEPWRKALSICLNDGGHTSICLCEECRKLDPADAAPISILLFSPVRRKVQYVSLTDRVLTFTNRVAELVTAKFPDRKLTLYAYAEYANPPRKVKPHPALILLSVSGNYTSDRGHEAALRHIASWSQFGNALLWRPNALFGWRAMTAPQNYARAMFDDLELFKANGLIGTDFDCFEQLWAAKGLVYYALCKAHWNPDRLDYDTLFEDYCTAGFGSAAPAVRRYFELLEKMNAELRASNGKTPYEEIMNETKIAELNGLLAEARKLAKDEPEVLARVNFLQTGMDYAADCRKIYVAKQNKSPEYDRLRKDFLEKVKARTQADPVAVSPLMMGFYSPCMPR